MLFELARPTDVIYLIPDDVVSEAGRNAMTLVDYKSHDDLDKQGLKAFATLFGLMGEGGAWYKYRYDNAAGRVAGRISGIYCFKF